MKTGHLIEMLSTNIEPVTRRRIDRVLIWTVVAGALGAFCVMLATVGPRTSFGGAAELGFLGLKLLLALGVIGLGIGYMVRSMHPGQEPRRPLTVLSLPFLVIGAAAVGALLTGPSATWSLMIFGTHWTRCLVCIPLFAVLPFAGLIWALRKGAPTNLRSTGALAGLVAGAVGAAAYAFHCPDDSLPFIAAWYGGSIALAGFIGAWIGPRLLRW